MANNFVLTKPVKYRLEAQGFQLTCASKDCRKPLLPGQEIISLTRAGKVKRRMHKKCFERLFM